jgi:UDP-glucose 4-epimerase
MKIAITGASGFLGSWICRVLAEQHEVIALVRESSDLTKISDLKTIQVVQRESSVWASFIVDCNPEILILNDWSGVSNKDRNRPEQFANVLRHHKLASAAVIAGVKTIIGVGSQAELGPIDSEICESRFDNPKTLYGQAKVDNRLMIDNITKMNSVRFVWMRIFSTYGPLDDGSWLIPNIVDSLERDLSIDLTMGAQEWSYLHAYDLAMAFAKVIENGSIHGVVNVGNPETIAIRSAASTIGKILKKEELLKFGALDYRIDQVMRLQPLCETLTLAGWSPQVSFNEGIQQTIDWLQRKPLRPIATLSGETLDFTLPVRP